MNAERPKRVAIVASNPAISVQTGWLIGCWWSELTHPYWEFVEHGYQVDIYYLLPRDCRRREGHRLFRMPGPGGIVVHAELQIGDARLMLAEESSDMDTKSPMTL